jgi:hypothetical protein
MSSQKPAESSRLQPPPRKPGPPPRKTPAESADAGMASPDDKKARKRQEKEEKKARKREEKDANQENRENSILTRRERRFSMRGTLHAIGPFFISMIVHLTLGLLLAFMPTMKDEQEELPEIVSEVYEQEEVSEDDLKFELQEQIVASDQMMVDAVAPSELAGEVGGNFGQASDAPAFDAKLAESLDGPQVKISAPNMGLPVATKLIGDVPDGALGQERMIVENVQEAMSRITEEIVWMLDKDDVLVIWCFDMSESMKDDQKEIRDRVFNVYEELGLVGRGRGARLTTAVTSYGERFFVNTGDVPTNELSKIRAAIDSIQIDPSGTELMCQAVKESIVRHRDYAKKTNRQMALILVTDESGQPGDNNMYLESAIAEAKDANCRMYVLGREAIFGYPHARMSWQHPQTKRWHWLLVDRGPETAFVEQLQTNGFHRRWDGLSSGFGPYEQARMSKETNGIFFMLPTVEKAQVAVHKRRYELEAMRSYRPDLRSKLTLFQERGEKPMQTFLWQVVSDLNPLESKEKARMLEMRMTFSLNRTQFVQQVRQSQAKALAYLNYLAAAEKVLIDNKRLREQETHPRWQANYDLMLAQVVAFQVRIYEYGVYLEWAIRNPQSDPFTAPPTKSPNLTLVHWDVGWRKKTFAEDQESDIPYPQRDRALEYMARAKQMFQEIEVRHPGTPWAERAKLEMSRGFGVHIRPDYDPPYQRVPPGVKTIPVPKL